uniref:F-box domain-containing protein n=1 Tax=Bionectria ochroleuca TaxID=29856 RepID=A0A8H7NMA2_BIOOC
MSAFLNLPNEIIYHILDFVPKRTLLKVCLVNQALRCYCEPSIYSNIRFHWDHQRRPPIIELLRTLITRPELFAYIDTLSLEGHDHYSLEPIPLEDSQVSEAFWEFAPIIATFDVPFVNQWVRELWAGSMGAFAALLLTRLSWTTHLTITYNFVRKTDLIGKVLQAKALGGLPRFHRLRHMVYIHGEEFAYSPEQRSKDGMALFYLPTVTNLAVWVRDPTVFRWLDGKPNLDRLTSLDIEGCCPTFVAKILALTPNLKSLAWACHYSYNTGDPWVTRSLNLDEIITTLSPVRGTLKRFQFRICIVSSYSPEYDSTICVSGSFEGLVHFDRITHLDVPLVCLAGFGPGPESLARYVPRSVEALFLSTAMLFDRALPWMPDEDEEWPEQEVMDLLLELDRSYHTRLPRLRHISINDEIDSLDISSLDHMLEETYESKC